MINPEILFIFGLGWPELLIITFVIILLAGPKRISKFARGLKESMREVKSAVAPDDEDEDEKKTAKGDSEKKDS